jgi:hypothetical protein
MIQLPEYLLWIGTALLAGYIAALGWRLGVSRHFPILTTYLILSLIADLARFIVLERLGFAAEQYMYTYYVSDSLLSVALYLVVVELYRRILTSEHGRFLPRYSLAMFVLLTVVSYAEVWQSHAQPLIAFAYQLATNFWFVSVGLTLLLWGFVYFRDLPRGIAARMVQVWGIYFLLMASTYFMFYFFHNLPPSTPRLHLEIPVMAQVWLPLGLGFAILNKSQNGHSSGNVPR